MMSLGHQVRCGARPANSATCWPVPLPSSRTSPLSVARIGDKADQMAS